MRDIKTVIVVIIIVVVTLVVNVYSLADHDIHTFFARFSNSSFLTLQNDTVTSTHEQAISASVPERELPLAARFLFILFFLDGLRMWLLLIIGSVFYRKKGVKNSLFMPKVTLVIPTWNEEVGIRRTLQSIIENGYPNYEIIVVNDGSTDQTGAKVQALKSLYPSVIQLINKANGGKAQAMNRGMLHATGEIIICVDADTYLHRNAIHNIVKYYEDPLVAAVVGNVLIGNTRTWLGKLQYFEYIIGFHLKRTQHVLNTIYILSGALCSYRKSVFDQLEGYTDYSKTEDMDLSLQMRQKNMRLVHAYDAVCSTEGASDLKGLINQRARWRYGGLMCLYHHRSLFLNPHKSFILSFYELPQSIYGIFQILIYPLILLIAYGAPLITGDYIYLVLVFLSIMINFILVFPTTRINIKMLKYFPLVTILMQYAMIIEHIALLKALQHLLSQKELSWTSWKREGIVVEPVLKT